MMVLKVAFAIVMSILAGQVLAADDLLFPNVDEKNIIIGKNDFRVGVYSVNDKSPSNFVFAVYKNGFLIKLRILDGVLPSIVSPAISAWPVSIFGIRMNQGGHERLIKYFSLYNDDVPELGEIGSNGACILSRPKMIGLIESVNEESGSVFLSAYKIEESGVKKVKSKKLIGSEVNAIKAWCAEYNLK
jgi:hypothetical protein